MGMFFYFGKYGKIIMFFGNVINEFYNKYSFIYFGFVK